MIGSFAEALFRSEIWICLIALAIALLDAATALPKAVRQDITLKKFMTVRTVTAFAWPAFDRGCWFPTASDERTLVVLGYGYWLKMVWVAAFPIAAKVIDNHSRWEFAILQRPHEAMGSPGYVPKTNPTVAPLAHAKIALMASVSSYRNAPLDPRQRSIHIFGVVEIGGKLRHCSVSHDRTSDAVDGQGRVTFARHTGPLFLAR